MGKVQPSEPIDRRMVNNGDNTLKQFFDRFYVIPKDEEIPAALLEFIKSKSVIPAADSVLNGNDGYIVFRKTTKKLSSEEVESIKNDNGTVRDKAKKYNLSVGTISKINNNRY